ncbi:hypothetical protein PCE1_001253 [Barthelona sp. PCE]
MSYLDLFINYSEKEKTHIYTINHQESDVTSKEVTALVKSLVKQLKEYPFFACSVYMDEGIRVLTFGNTELIVVVQLPIVGEEIANVINSLFVRRTCIVESPVVYTMLEDFHLLTEETLRQLDMIDINQLLTSKDEHGCIEYLRNEKVVLRFNKEDHDLSTHITWPLHVDHLLFIGFDVYTSFFAMDSLLSPSKGDRFTRFISTGTLVSVVSKWSFPLIGFGAGWLLNKFMKKYSKKMRLGKYAKKTRAKMAAAHLLVSSESEMSSNESEEMEPKAEQVQE